MGINMPFGDHVIPFWILTGRQIVKGLSLSRKCDFGRNGETVFFWIFNTKTCFLLFLPHPENLSSITNISSMKSLVSRQEGENERGKYTWYSSLYNIPILTTLFFFGLFNTNSKGECNYKEPSPCMSWPTSNWRKDMRDAVNSSVRCAGLKWIAHISTLVGILNSVFRR